MEQTTVSEPTTRLEKLATESIAAGYGLNVLVVYEDAATRKWAREVFERAATVAGQDHVRATWWKLGDLDAPGVLAGAVSTGMRADVIIVAARGAEALPMSFYVWAEAWLAHRSPGAGALVALLGKSQEVGGEEARLRRYLNEAAREAHLELFMEERELPKAGFSTTDQDLVAFDLEPGSRDTELFSLAFAS